LVGFRISSGARQGEADVNGGGAELLAGGLPLYLADRMTIASTRREAQGEAVRWRRSVGSLAERSKP
jgi:hypothetical protein